MLLFYLNAVYCRLICLITLRQIILLLRRLSITCQSSERTLWQVAHSLDQFHMPSLFGNNKKSTKPCHAGFTSYINGWSVMGQSVKWITCTEIPRFKSRLDMGPHSYWPFSTACFYLVSKALCSLLTLKEGGERNTHRQHFYSSSKMHIIESQRL